MASWSPDSTTFFIDDGQGSGMASTLRVFALKGDEFVENDAFQRAAVAAYRRQKRCDSDAADPNVYGMGWSHEGAELFAFAQTTVHYPCGPSAAFLGFVFNSRTGEIQEQLSEQATKKRFPGLLPDNMRR